LNRKWHLRVPFSFVGGNGQDVIPSPFLSALGKPASHISQKTAVRPKSGSCNHLKYLCLIVET
jgi:hypothetical protein